MIEGLIVLTVLFAAYALLSHWLGRSSLTGPMLFLAAGVVIGLTQLAEGTPLIEFIIELDSDGIQTLLEATLVIVLFSDAVMIDYRSVRREAFLPTRLLGIGLPLTVVFGTIVATLLFPDIGFWGAVVIAVILAPTDAALGQAVVSNEGVPSMVRQGLGVESGLNDGIAVPFLTIAVAGAANEMQNAGHIAAVFIEEIGFALVVGLAVGLLGGWLVLRASDRGLTSREGRRVIVVFLAILAYSLADLVGGSGFIAAFVGGLAFGAQVRGRFPRIHLFAEGVAHLLTMASFLVFGAVMLTPRLEHITLKVLAYAILSLTVIRFVPVWIALLGSRLRPPTIAFIGWFGPRGLASLVFVGTIVLSTDMEGRGDILTVGSLTVCLSVVLHGITAWPASLRYGAWFHGKGDGAMAEADEVSELPVRQPGIAMPGSN